jgi:predicted TIM-barrel fold metal-dependent hydrolase
MMNRLLNKLALGLVFLVAQPVPGMAAPVSAASAPIADHHQHLFSPAVADMVLGAANPGISAKDVVALLDTAHIQRGVLLSVAYMYGSPKRQVHDEYAKVRAENDWTAEQAAQYPDRLIAFCSFNPLKEYALDELKRCASRPGLRHGIKLHFGNGDVQLELPEHAERLRQVFRAANANRMAIAVHMRASISLKRPYGPAQAKIFLEQLMPLATDIPVQIAHMAGTGPGYNDPQADSALAVFADAIERGDPRTRQIWFDVASVAAPDISPAQAELLVKRIRQVGVGRVLYGSDAAYGDTPRPREGWAAFRKLPLTEAEFAQIAGNLAPYFR